MRRFIFADELFQVGLIEEQAPADLDGPDLLCPVEPGKPAKAYPEQARRLPRREELGHYSGLAPLCSRRNS